jgi:pimeloyl-ACP methyl ester carboxylesterase
MSTWLALGMSLALGILSTSGPGAETRAASNSTETGIANVGSLFVGGHYSDDRSVMVGQSHVFYLLPARRTHRTPLIFIPGMGQTITNFLSTPDGRDGWAKFFVDRGWAVYLMDQPGRGASGYNREAYGPASRQSPLLLEQRFTAPQDFAPKPGAPYGWPQARLHRNWPGTGVSGDPAFDQFYASQVESADGDVSARLVSNAGAALLDRIGPAVVVTHSQAGAFGWAIGEARPSLVKAIVAVEPGGPPFFSAPPPWGDGNPDKLSRRFGLTNTPLAYDPSLTDSVDLTIEQERVPAGPDLVRCWLQKNPARRLTNLSRIPVMILVSEASYHAGYDHCTARYLVQAGVRTDFVRLGELGLHGDGHMMMLEKNSTRIAVEILRWMDGRTLE